MSADIFNRVREVTAWVARRGPTAPRLRELGADAVEQIIGATEIRLLDDGEFAALPDGSAEQLASVNRALDAERNLFKRKNPRATVALESVGARATDPLAVLERQEVEAANALAEERRPAIEAAENADFQKAVAQLAATLDQKERYALQLMGRGFNNTAVREATKKYFRRGLDRPRITRLRAQLTKLAERWLTIAPLPEEPDDLQEVYAPPADERPKDSDSHYDGPECVGPYSAAALASGAERPTWRQMVSGDVLYSPTGPIPRPRSVPATPSEVADWIKAHGTATAAEKSKARSNKSVELARAESRRTQLRQSQRDLQQEVRRADARVTMIRAAERLGIPAQSVLDLETAANAEGISLGWLLGAAVKPAGVCHP